MLDKQLIEYLSSQDLESVRLGIALFDSYPLTYRTVIASILQEDIRRHNQVLNLSDEDIAKTVLWIALSFGLWDNPELVLEYYVKYRLVPNISTYNQLRSGHV